MPDQVLDTKGLNCPLPILKAKKEIAGMNSGQTLEVHSTDPGSVMDFEALCRQTGHKLLESSQENGVYIFLLEKSGA
ncbi:MAG: sulfurtransferase TusA family protein [Acidiferrobacterales bacterium]|nr:sulfurtransferase TusA family protein [Acidiferrobacterales bacterium]